MQGGAEDCGLHATVLPSLRRSRVEGPGVKGFSNALNKPLPKCVKIKALRAQGSEGTFSELLMRSKKVGIEVLAAIVVCTIIGFFSGPSLAQKPFLERLKKAYTLPKDNGNCKLCHDYDKEKNESPELDNLGAYGKAIQASDDFKPLRKKGDEHKFTPEETELIAKAAKALEDKDTDGDGATNIEELALATFPGNAKSTPTKEALDKYRADHKK